MDGYTDHGGAQHAVVKFVTGSEFGEDRAVGMVVRFDALDRLMQVRIELLALGFDALQPELGKSGPEAAIDKVEAFAEFFVTGVAMGFEGALEIVENGQDGLNGVADGAMMFGGTVALDTFAVVFEIGLEADERIEQVVAFRAERIEIGPRNRCRSGDNRKLGRSLVGRRWQIVRGRIGGRSFALGVRVVARFFRQFAHEEWLPER